MDFSDSEERTSNLKRKRTSDEFGDNFEETDLQEIFSDLEEETIEIKEKETNTEEIESINHSKITEKDKKQFGNFSGENSTFET
jgi:hypothetical protein